MDTTHIRASVPRQSRLRIVGAALAAVLVAGLFAAVSPAPAAEAATVDNASFDPGFIISDDVFFNSSAMTLSSIKSFLKAKDPSCTTHKTGGRTYSCIATYTAKFSSRAADKEGNCKKITGNAKESAASIIYRVSKACGINPQVILVTLEKEQGLITGGARNSDIYRKAMGFGCPDTAACNSKYYGFANQVYSAAWQFKQYVHSTNPSFRHGGSYYNIKYHPSAACKTSRVYVTNDATAGLYNYTPYQPNAAALAAGKGTGDKCSSYGNRNFWRFFTGWFGNPANLVPGGSLDGTTAKGWSQIGGKSTISLVKKNPKAQSGTGFLSIKTAKAGRSVARTITRSVAKGKAYEATVWVRAKSAAVPYNGRLILTGLGGSFEREITPFVATGEWTQVSATFVAAKSKHSKLRLQIVEDTKSNTLWVDSVSIAPVKPPTSVAPVTVKSASFEAGKITGFKSGTGGKVNFAVKKTTSEVAAQDGKEYLSASTFDAGASFNQDITRKSAKGDSFTATAWVRSAPGETATGKIALVGLGGHTDVTKTSFAVGPEWTQVTATLTVAQAKHTGLRIAVYLNEARKALYVDNFTLTPNLLSNPSFEAGNTEGWFDTGSKSAPTVVMSASKAKAGTDYLAISRTTASTTRFSTDVERTVKIGQTYTFGGWFRSSSETVPYTGSIRLIARGNGDSEYTTKTFEVGSTWTYVEVKHKATSLQTTLRADITVGDETFPLEADALQLR